MVKFLFNIFFVALVGNAFSQNVAGNYVFSNQPTAAYTAIAGTTVHAVGVDDAISASITLPFTFQYGCSNKTTIKISSNGWLTFNTGLTGSSNTNDLDNASNSLTNPLIVAPLWDDHAVGTGGAVRYQTTGTAPNRIFKVEWFKTEWSYSATNPVISFQAWLYETSNLIEFRYLQEAAAVSGGGASIGLMGATSGDFISINTTPAASTVTETSNITTKPINNAVYRFTPNSCSGAPTAGTAVASPSANCGPFTTTLSLTGNTASCGITYEWYHCNTAGGTYTSVATATTVSSQTFAITSATPKFFKCVVTCGASSATTAVISASVSASAAGAGSYSVTLPYAASGLTNCGAGNDITSTNVSALCGSNSYLGGEDAVYIFTPTITTAFSGSLTSASSWVGMTLFQGCPTTTGTCVDYSQGSSGNQSITSCTNVLTAGQTYYLVVDAFPSPTCHPTYSLNLSMSGCSGMPIAGTAVTSPSVNCSSFTTTLSLTGSTGGCGLTYEWFHSNAAAGTYSSIAASSSSSTQTFAVTGTKYFKAVVTCGASSATTAVISASINPNSVGTGALNVSLPYTSGAQTTCGNVDDITSTNVTNICGSSSYYTGEDAVYIFTPTVTAAFNATLTSGGSYTGLMLYNGCPTGTGVCVANNQSSTGTKTLATTSGSCVTTITVTAGNTYYLIVDSYDAPDCNAYSIAMATTSLSASSGTICNLNYSATSTTFSFEVFTGTSLPTTDDVLFADYIDLGFPFCYDGQSYSGGYVASNSSFVFDAVPCFPNISTSTYAAGGVSTGYSISGAAPINGTSVPRNAILAPWHDINPASSATVAASRIQYAITGTSPNRKAVISWEEIPMYSGACETIAASRASSQIKIFEIDGSIEIHIKNKQVCASWNGGDAILGLQNYNGTIYVPAVNVTAHNYPTDWTMTNTAYKFTSSCSGTGACLTVLPINFKEFHGDHIDGVNTVWWSTALEENLLHFVVERSQDGINFTDIGTVIADNKASTYTYKDYQAPEGIINYYRVRSVEMNEKTVSTNIVSINGGKDDLLTTWPIYPNPAKTEVNVRLNSKKEGNAIVVVYDVFGSKVIEEHEKLGVGVRVYGVNVEKLSKGVYFIEIQNDLNEVITKQKLVIE